MCVRCQTPNHHQTHHLFLTRRALYVIAFDINKYRPQHFKQQIMFFVSKLQSRVPAAPVVLVGTHADMVNEEEANERCAHVLSMLTRKQQRERRRLLAQIEERQKQIVELEKVADNAHGAQQCEPGRHTEEYSTAACH